MKQITAIIKPQILSKVEYALHQLEHFPGFTLLRVRGDSRGSLPGHAYHPSEWDLDEHDKVALLILCSDDLAPAIISVIRENAHTGLRGDGVIAVIDVAEVIRIRTGERNEDAV